MKCPKCSSSFRGKPNEAGLITCPSCGARLRTKTTAVFKAQGEAEAGKGGKASKKGKASKAGKAAKAAKAEPPPIPKDASSALPPKPLPSNVPAKDAAAAKAESWPPIDIDATIPRGMTAADLARSGTIPSPAARSAPRAPGPATLESIQAEVRAIRQAQAQILALLKGEVKPADLPPLEPPTGAAPRPVLVVDDDAESQDEVMQALSPDLVVKKVSDGNEALAAIALEKPRAIVVELEVGGAMSGVDLVNMIKATMEWVDIPLLLHTRASFASEDEARDAHGVDRLIPKGPGSSAALADRLRELLGTT